MIDKDNVVVIGHGRLLAAKLLKIDKVPIVRAADMSEDDIKAMRLADNKTNESDWDMSALENELQALEISGIDMSLFGFDKLEETSDSNPYTGTTNIPQYEPTGENVTIDGLVESFKTDSLLNEIEESSVTEEEKEFLRLAAQRHLAFNYKKIAEYYANASEEMQELMEKSALVIIDYKDAIANGFTRLTDTVTEMFEDWEG